jgi:hypothetical protein
VPKERNGVIEIHWEIDPWGRASFCVYDLNPEGRLAILDSFDSAPFATALEGSQRLVRTIARHLHACGV